MDGTDLEDVALLAGLRAGDQDAFRALYRRHAARLHGFALKMLNSADDAEEMVEEVFMEVWQRAGSYDPRRGPPLAWIFIIARSRIIDRLRRRQRAQRALAWQPEVVKDPHDETWTRLVAGTVRAAVDGLPREQREVLDACYYGGLSQSEAASLLGLPLGTVKTRARAALQRLRGDLSRSEVLADDV
ncbi:MAG: sigma-70 family RNA polymerase sigma factor [Candidatus Dormibacteraceae bacterium]